MKKKLLYVVLSFPLLLTLSCTKHYQLESVSRSRILIDNRYDATPDGGAAAFIAPFKQKVDSVMSPVVGRTACYMAAERPESNLSNLLSDILVWAAGNYGEKVDFGMYNIGGIRAGFAEGNVTYGDVLDVAPFENKICFLDLKGDKVAELFGQIAKRLGEGVSRAVKMRISADGKLLSALVDGKEIDPNATYRIATIDYVAQGNDQLEAFKAKTNLNSPQEEKNNMRFIIIDYFREQQRQGKTVDAKVEGRIEIEK